MLDMLASLLFFAGVAAVVGLIAVGVVILK